MDMKIEANVEPRKEWATPELKKVDIQEITASGGVTGHDTFTHS
jgi:hypothetical protein